MVVLFAGLLGLLVGSFLNVVVHRLPRRESLVRPRSRCPGCGEAIRARDNLPVVSWLLLRGRCRSCGKAISPRYPALELACGALFAVVVIVEGVRPELVLSLPLAAVLLAVAAIDFEHHVVPNRIVLPAAIYAVGAGLLVNPGEVPEHLAAGAAAFLGLLLAAVAYPAGMGMGDVKLAGMLGLFLGLDVVPALFIAFFVGALVGLILIARGGPAARKTGVPFAPFLALGGFLGLLAGAELVNAYRTTFLG
jgi:leader peptidase (prepilin peptidase)/N-methyltransferase